MDTLNDTLSILDRLADRWETTVGEEDDTFELLGDLAERWEALVAERDQLQGALTSRIRVEQAKGILMVTFGIDIGEAFTRLRFYSRDHNLPIQETSQQIIDAASGANRWAVLNNFRSRTTRRDGRYAKRSR